jgi:hypothetical protein
MAEEILTQSERMELVKIREDYINILHTKPELRLESPDLWHGIVDQFEAITDRLEADVSEKCLATVTRKLNDNDELMIKKLNGVEHPLGEWERANG